MWFLNGRPDGINCRAVVSSIAGGYQQTSIRFSINASSKTWIAIAFPWSAHKENGSLEINKENLVDRFDIADNVTNISATDVEIWERLRSLKTQPDIELVHVQELINWYLDDIGVMTLWVEPNQTYQINYRHKIGADSCLFLPTRLPVIISARKPQMDYRLWVLNGIVIDLPKWLKRVRWEEEVAELEYNEWDWDEDTRINTDNWESSDDISSDESE